MSVKVGIDIGSVATKCVLVKDSQVIGKVLTKTGTDNEVSADNAFQKALEIGDISRSDVASIISTGYGRRLFKKADKVITEISAVARGAFCLSTEEQCLIIDVGGQDTKIVEIGVDGEVIDFLMNDKCAAGTGRFLELMANVLETDLDGFSKLSLSSQNPVTINSTCSVFAESEIVSLMAKATKKEDIAAGLITSIAVRITGMISQFGKHGATLFCGGGAQSEALKKMLEKKTGRTITVLNDPQFVTAFGAALS